MTIDSILADLDIIKKDSTLHHEKNFRLRLKAIDHIELHIIDRIDSLLKRGGPPGQMNVLRQHAEKVRRDLEDVDARMFDTLRTKISQEDRKKEMLLQLIDEYVDQEAIPDQDDTGYTSLDIFLNGLLTRQSFPIETKVLEPEMVYFQKTPARTIFELVEKCRFTREDVFMDLGSGMGQVTILVNLLTGIKARGVEFEPAFCNYARGCAAELNLSDVTFTQADAREADYSEGTVFFMFTPFHGEMLENVLRMLKKESLIRKIRIITLGPCTVQVSTQPWLNWLTPKHDDRYRLGMFSSG